MSLALRLGAALVALAGLLALRARRRGLLGRGEALAWLALLGLLAVALAPALLRAGPAVLAALALAAALATRAGRLAELRGARDDRDCEALVERARAARPAGMAGPVDLVLVMPALDEADNLRALLPGRPRMLLGRVAHLVVVDDGSRDATSEVAAAHGAWAIRSPHNRGGGFALRVGFAAARRLGARYVITLDADGQHRFADLPTVLAPLLAGDADLVVGSRRLGRAVGGARLRGLGVRVFSAALSWLTGRRITDCASGLRGLDLRRLADLRLQQARHHTAELLLEAARRELRIVEVPITIVPRHTGRSKKGRDLVYALRFAATIAAAWWRR